MATLDITLASYPDIPPNGGYRIDYRKVGTTAYTTVTVATLPYSITITDASASYEGFVYQICSGVASSPKSFFAGDTSNCTPADQRAVLYDQCINNYIQAAYADGNCGYYYVPTATYCGTSSSGTGGGSGCPTPDMLILMDVDSWMAAGDLTVGHRVYTVHEKTNEWGYFTISHISREQQATVSIAIADKVITVSDSHKLLTESGEYIPVSGLKSGDRVQTINGAEPIKTITTSALTDVIRIEVEEAHTYVVEGIISHNKLIDIAVEQ